MMSEEREEQVKGTLLEAEEPMTPERRLNRAKLYAKIAAVMADVGGVPERGRNEFHGYSYRTAADVFDAARPILAKHGLVIIPSVRRLTVAEGKGSNCDAEMEYRLCCAETGEVEVVRWRALGADTQDKGPFKAYTGGMKYFLVNLLKIGDDTADPDAGEGTREGARESNERSQPKATPKAGTDRKRESKQDAPPAVKAPPEPGPIPIDRSKAKAEPAQTKATPAAKPKAEPKAEPKAAPKPAPAPAPEPEPEPEEGDDQLAPLRKEVEGRINLLVDPAVKLSPEESNNVLAAGRLAEKPDAPAERLTKAVEYLRTLYDKLGLEYGGQDEMELGDKRPAAPSKAPPPMSD